MKHLRFLLMAALVAMPLTACDEDDDPVEPEVFGTVTGTVSADGTGLAGVAVTLVGTVDQSASTGAGGTYTFTNVPGGSYGVSIDPSSHPDVSWGQTGRATTITVNGETQTVDFPGSYIKTSTITGVVSASGAPLAGVAVTVAGGPESVNNSYSTNAGGEYFATGLRAGTYTVTVANVAGVTFASQTATVTVGVGETQSASFPGEAVQMATIAGAVTIDNVGTAGVTVTLSGGDLAAAVDAETGPQGAYSFGNLTPGAYTVTVTPPSDDVTFETLAKNVDAVAGQTAVVNFAGTTPAEPATVSISAVTKGGAPIVGATMGQIEVTLNVERNDQTPDYVDVLIGDVVVATQQFQVPVGGAEMAGPSDPITVTVPTDQLMMGTNGLWTSAVKNGGNEVSANLYVVEVPLEPTPANKVPIVIENYDLILPGNDFGGNLLFEMDEGYNDYTTSGGTLWNRGSATFSGPVFISYTTETPTAVTFAAACAATGTGTVAGDHLAGISITNNYLCTGFEGNVWPDHNDYAVTYATGVGPDGTAVMAQASPMAAIGAEFFLSDGTVGPRRLVISEPIPAQIDAADDLNIDNIGPTVTMQPVAFMADWDEWWINADYSLIDGLVVLDGGGDPFRDDDPIQLADGGVGADWDSREARLPGLWIDTSTIDYWACDVAVTNAELDPTNTSDWDVDGHMICGFGTDYLGNPPQNAFLPLLPAHNGVEGFGKDILNPAAYMIGDSPGANAVVACTAPYPAIDEGLNDPDNLFNIASPMPVVGFGVDATDNAAGFHQQDFGASTVGPVDQSITRYYPDIADATTESDETAGPAWLSALASPTHVRSTATVGGLEDCMDLAGGHFDPDDPGLYVWMATVTDMAGNTASLSQDFATDQVNIPVLVDFQRGALAYTAGAPGLFYFWGTDDFEVDEVQVSMTYPTDADHNNVAADLEVVYPSVAVDPAQSPWDMGYSFDQLGPYTYNAGLQVAADLNLGIVGRIDFTTAAGAVVDDFNFIDGLDADLLMEDDDLLPTDITGWIATDILGNGPSAATGTETFTLFDVGGWTNSTPAPWPSVASGIIETFELIDQDVNADPNDFIARHTAPNSVINPFFERVFLVHQDAAFTTLTICGEMSVKTQYDQGFNRIYDYELVEQFDANDLLIDPDIDSVCLNAVAGDQFHAAGLKTGTDGGAFLVTADGVSIIHP